MNVTVNYFSVLGDPGSWSHCLSATLSPERHLHQAGVLVITDRMGDETASHWRLSRQSEGEFRDCWMTDAVIPAKQPPQREFVQMPVLQQHRLAPRA